MIHKILKKLSKIIPITVVTKNTSLILLYHSVFNEIPNDIRNGLDNVTTDILYEQLTELKKYYTVVSVDEYFNLENKNGYACVTFDDAYQNVISNGLKIFEDLNIPITIFVNSSTLSKKIFWRDKVRYIINNNLTSEFEEFSKEIKIIKEKGFYKYSKMNINNSCFVEKEIDSFFKYMNLESSIINYCINLESQLINHSLVSYGNHSHSHYVLSSLTYEEQYQEIMQTKLMLNKLDVNQSNLFSLPFGGEDDYNDDTVDIIKKLGYKGMLMSRNRINISTQNNFLLERFMPLHNNMKNNLKFLFLKSKLYFRLSK